MRTIGNPRHVIVESNGGLPVNIQDQTTPIFDVYFGLFGTDAAVAAPTVYDTYTITTTDGTVFTIGNMVVLADEFKIYFSEILNIVGNVLTVSDPLPGVFAIGSLARPIDIHMNVDGSVTRQYYRLRAPGETQYFPYTVDITQIMIQMITNTATQLSDFGDIAGGITNGVVLRKIDGLGYNLWNAKKNSDFAIFANDYATYSALNPAGNYGIAARYEMGGQNKHGAVIRIAPGESLEVIIQDDLTSILEFRMMAQGHAISDQDLVG